MNKYYTKLNPIDLNKFINFKILGHQYTCAGSMAEYSYVDIDSSIIIPKEYQQWFFLTHWTIGGKIVPHRDQGIQTKINIYLSDNHAGTKFYSSSDAADYKEIAKDCSGCTYDKFTKGECACGVKPDNLTVVDQFEANQYDAYLLNTTEMHGVDEITSDNPRVALTLTTGMDYGSVYKMLKSHGLLNV
jgi:hypothetical protein